MSEEAKKQLEQYSAEKLAAAAEREQTRLNKTYKVEVLLSLFERKNIKAKHLYKRAARLQRHILNLEQQAQQSR